MTNREVMIKQLQERDDNVIANLMCPMVPGGGQAFCNTDKEAEDAIFSRDCKPCMRAWLDRQADDEEAL